MYLTDIWGKASYIIDSESTTVHHSNNMVAFKANGCQRDGILIRPYFKDLLAWLNVDKAHDAILAQNT